MSASAKPTEKLFKSFLAAVLAISLCPLMPAEKAQAEEAGDSGEQTDAAQVSDEGEGEETDLAEGIVETDGPNADLGLAEGNNDGTEDEGALDDSNVALQAASDSGTPIVNWTECGTCQWMIDSSGCLTIKPKSGSTSGELARWYSSEGGPWRSSSVTTVRVLHGVKAKTTARMFAACRNLTFADLSELDTSSVTDMGEMFCNCSSLKSVDLSGLDTSSATNMSEMFSGCSKLAKLDLSSFDTSNVKEGSFSAGGMRGMFSGCSSLTSLDLSSFDTSNVTGMGNMFSDCSSLTSLGLSSFDTSNVQGMYDMFSGCSSLASLDLSSFDTSNVQGMSGMFSGCSSLTSLDLSSFDTSNVENMGAAYEPDKSEGMFSGCTSLASLDLSNFDTSATKCMSFMFYGCSALASLDLPGFATSSPANMSHMFYNCSALETIRFADSKRLQISNAGSMFSSCSKLASLDLSSFDTSSATSMVGMFSGCSSLASLDLSSLDTSSVTGMGAMFSGCSKLANLDLSSFDTSSVTGMGSMFSGCSSLSSLDLSPLDTSSVTDMSSMFSGCSKLVELNLSSLDTSKVKEGSRSEGGMSSMFSGCSSLTSLDLSSFDTSNVTGMGGMFSGCSKLATLDLSSFNTSNVKGDSGIHRGMSEMFSGCSSLINLDLSSFDTSNVGYMSGMFDGCLRLETLNLSSFNAGSVVDMGSMFKGCQSLKTISFPAVLNTPKVTNFSGMFSDCRSLEGLDVSGFDTSAAKSLSSMFSGCTKLAALDVSNFGTSAATSLSSMFYGCESLRSLDLSGFDTSAADYRYGLSGFLDGCKSLRTVTLGPKFSFEGAGLDRQCSLPTPEDNGLSGRWISSKDGIAYTSSGVPSNVAATYTAQEMGDTRAWNQNGTCIWNIDENGRLTVKPTTSESGELYSSCPWRDEKSRIKTVYFEKGVVAPKSMDSMFCDCKALISADLGNLDTSRATGMDYLFEGCSLLERVSLSNVDTSNVTSMVAMFSNCFSLKSLDLSSFDTSNVTSMRGMFNGCRAIESLDLSAFDTSSVTDMDLMFFSCYRLLDLNVSSFDTSNVRDMEDMFFDCRSLVSLDLSSFDTSSTTAMRSMFGGNCAIALLSVTFGEKFSFCGSSGSRLCALPSIISEGRTGLWVSSADGKAYAPDEIPNNVAATYTAQVKSEVPKTSISESMFAVDTRAKTYTGSPIEPSVSSGSLQQGTDYDVSYRENVNAGEGTILITGAGNYTGQVTYSFRIDPIQVDAPKAAADLVYSGAEQVGVAPSDDYEVAGGSATNAGDYEAAASLKDKKNYVWAGKDGSDDLKISWSIAKAVLVSSMVSGVPSSIEATGSQLAPKPIVTFKGKTLAQGADYSLSYGENVSPGKGSVTVTAIGGGNFTGSATVEFDIEKKAEPAPEPQRFAVIYHLDGGANATDNPATYMAGTAVPLADPTKEGFEFQGWYADAEFTVRVTEIPADASGDVELWAKWKEQKPAPVFTDVDYSDTSWYGDAVSYVASKGLITGYSGTALFGVGDVLTRAQLATILWRNACPDEYASYDPETAVDTTGIDGSADGMYYTAAANWAVRNGVITGFDREDGSKDFAADENVSFEQLVTILSRLCATPEELSAAGSDLSAFADGDLASSWSRGAFAWAAAKGLVQGYDEPAGKYLRPGDPVARERVAVVLMRAFEMGVMK